MKRYLLIVSIVFVTGTLFAQLDQTAFTESHKISQTESNKLFFSVLSQNIIKNNEYFNHLAPGYTLLGSQAFLRLKYYPLQNMSVEAGIYMRYYYGTGRLNSVQPLIRLSYRPVKGLYLVMGNIYGALYHGFPEPMYKFERFMEESPATGLQLLYDNNRFHADAFVNWRYFLLPEDMNHDEKFTAGLSAYFNLLNPRNRLQIQIPLQVYYYHEGGQYDTLSLPLKTLRNTAFGIKTGYRFSGFVKKIAANLYYLTYRDGSTQKVLPFDKGYGLMPEVSAESQFVNLHAGYWKGHNFYAPLGEPLFSSASYSIVHQGETFPQRSMFYFKADFHHTVAQGINIGARYEGYLDLIGNTVHPEKKHFDFSYGIYLNFQHDFFLLKTKK